VGIVQLSRGKITNAISPVTGSLAEYLVRSGLVAPDALRELAHFDASPASDATVGRWLLDHGLLAGDLGRAVTARIHAALSELVTWDDGRFAFDPAAAGDPGLPEIDVALDPQQLLLNIFRMQDELNRAR
jgi:hypothetical protein